MEAGRAAQEPVFPGFEKTIRQGAQASVRFPMNNCDQEVRKQSRRTLAKPAEYFPFALAKK
jgi:hypothetical protein